MIERNRHKRRHRKLGNREISKRVLIVCEGKTEWHYFEEIRIKYHVPIQNMTVVVADGQQIRKVVDHAVRICNDDQDYDYVFAVFDKDDEANLKNQFAHAEAETRKLRRKYKKPENFSLVLSVPCFELWPLLHFEFIQDDISRDDLIKRLRKHLPKYEKPAQNLFHQTIERQSIANKNAERLWTINSRNLSATKTTVHLLVSFLEFQFNGQGNKAAKGK